MRARWPGGPPMADVGVRAAGPDHVAGIARLQLATWRTAYSGILGEHVLAGLDEDDVSRTWGAAVNDPPSPRHRVLIALDGAAAVGFVAFGPATAEESAPASAALISTLLVEPRWGRRGHGSRLLAATVDLLRDDGFAIGLTWLLEPDRVSNAFFGSAGWEPDGSARTLDIGGRFVTEIRLHASLAEPAP